MLITIRKEAYKIVSFTIICREILRWTEFYCSPQEGWEERFRKLFFSLDKIERIEMCVIQTVL